MQSSRKVKRVQEYKIGERVYDGDYLVGRVAAIDEHPDRRSIGYILVVSDEGYTTLRGSMDLRQWLCVARVVPESVAMYFAEVVLGKDVQPKTIERFPVVEEEKEEKEEADEMIEEASSKVDMSLAPMPYLDVV